MVSTAANSSRKVGFRPRAGSSGTASTVLASPSGALGFTGELAVDLFDACTLTRKQAGNVSESEVVERPRRKKSGTPQFAVLVAMIFLLIQT
jgi:hypothetical protein